jgi:hypothetical protein
MAIYSQIVGADSLRIAELLTILCCAGTTNAVLYAEKERLT